MGFTFNIPIREDQLQASLKSAQDKHDRETLNAAITLEGSIRESVDAEIKSDIQSLRTDLLNEVTLRADNENFIRQDYQSKINAEETARIQSDAALQNNIAAEKSARQSAITTLTDKVNTDFSAEKQARISDIASLKSAIDTEISNRKSADNNLADTIHGFYDPKISSLSTAIANEVTLSAARDNELAQDFATNLTAETNARVTADNSLKSALDKEIANRQSDTAKLNASITAETSARQSDTSRLSESITAEKSARESVDAAIKADIQSLRAALTNEGTLRANNEATLKSALDTEKTERIACDTAVVNSIRNYYDPKIDSLATALENEITLSASRDNSALAVSLAAETSARIAADNSLSSAVNNEKLARQSDTSRLQTLINNEVTARQSDTSTLRTLISNEKSARESDTSRLQTLISNEVNARQSDTAKLSASIESAVAGIKDYVPATDDTAGTHGFVPVPPANSKKMILTHDGGWQEISEAIPSLSPRILTKPTLKKADLAFNFREQSPELNDFDSDTMTIKGIDSAINVGSYTIIVAIKDKTRCFWDLETEDVEDVVFEWNIVKNNLIPKPTLNAVTEGSYTTTKNSTTYITFDYDGTVKTCEPIFADDYPGLNYVNVTGNFSEVNADEYIITVSLKDIKQTCWKDGTVSTVRLYFRIVPAKLTVEQSTFTQTETLTYSPGVTYTIFDVFPTLDSDFYVIPDDVTSETAAAVSFSTQVKTDDNHTYSNDTTSKYVHWEIDKRIVPASILLIDSESRIEYDGTPKEVEIDGLDTDTAYIRSDSEVIATTAGYHSVRFVLSDPVNYAWGENDNSTTRGCW